MARPDVTFIVAAKDVRLYVADAVHSAMAQVEVSSEILVVDDASTDDTAEIVAAIAARDPRVRMLRNAESLGPAGARNRALEEARGHWIAILDADDVIAPNRTKTLLALAAETGCEIVADNVMRFRSDDPLCEWPLLSGRQFEKVRRIEVADFLRMNCMTRGDANLGFLKPVFSRDFLDRQGIRYDENLRIGEDFDICLRCMSQGARYAITPLALYNYRIRPDSTSRRLKQSDIRSLIAAHRRAESRLTSSSLTRRAYAAYERSLNDALVYVAFREALRDRRMGRLVAAGLRPRLWRALVDVSIGVVQRRHQVMKADRERRLRSTG